MRILERARFEEIMEGDCEGSWDGDNAFGGLKIMHSKNSLSIIYTPLSIFHNL